MARQHAWGLTDVEWLDGDEARAPLPLPGAGGGRARATGAGDGWLDVRRLTMGYAAAPAARDASSPGHAGDRLRRWRAGGCAACETPRGAIARRPRR